VANPLKMKKELLDDRYLKPLFKVIMEQLESKTYTVKIVKALISLSAIKEVTL